MDDGALLRRLMSTFLGELSEHVQQLEQNLLALERNPDPPARSELLTNLFRTAHTLKGAARSVGIELLEKVGHHLESIFVNALDSASSMGPERFELLFATVDAIKDAARRLRAGESIEETALPRLLPTLQTATDTVGVTPEPELNDVPPDPVASQAPAAANREESVRILSSKLDQMLALGGELLAARRRAEGREGDVAHLLDVARRLEADWREAARTLGRSPHRSMDGAAVAQAADESVRALTSGLERSTHSLQWLARRLEGLATELAADRKALDQVVVPLDTELLHTRLVPFAEACEGFERAVRDLALAGNKNIDLIVDGGEIEIDRLVVEGIKDPLLHLLRNAVDHGVETPAVRAAAGKSERGEVRVSAALRNGRVEIVVADDGRGFDLDAIGEQARRRGLSVPTGDEEVARLVFAPGFSTASAVTTVSGRGVGLDVVKSGVESQRGTVGFSFEAGRGTRFVLNVPLTLTRLRTLLIVAGGQTYAFDSADVRTLVRAGSDELRTVEGRDVLMLNGAPIPVVFLAEALGRPARKGSQPGGKVPVVVLEAGTERAAFAVDELLAEQEVVVKDLGARLRSVPNVAGSTILATGRIALILNAADLVRAALAGASLQAFSAALSEPPAEAKKRLLVVEDSVTTRTLVKGILEAAGFEVSTAVDGMDAWQSLQESGVDVVVSDVEMPRMDGFALTEAIRGSRRFQGLPIILVTAMETEQDRLRGMEAGADAYLVKSSFDQIDLIRTIEQVL